MLSQPDLLPDAVPYWEAFSELDEERALRSLSLGMSGAIDIPRTIRRSEIRRDGRALGYRGDDLEDFYGIIRGIDHFYVAQESKRAMDDAKKRAAKANKKKR